MRAKSGGRIAGSQRMAVRDARDSARGGETERGVIRYTAQASVNGSSNFWLQPSAARFIHSLRRLNRGVGQQG